MRRSSVGEPSAVRLYVGACSRGLQNGDVYLRALGGIELVTERGPTAIGGPQQRRLLAILLANRRRVVALDTLMDAVWDGEPPATARATLQTAVSKLRRVLGVDLRAHPPGYVLDVDVDRVDADRFEAAVATARASVGSDPACVVERLSAALAEWRGPAFAEFAGERWAVAEARRLEELRLQAVEMRARAWLDLGDADAVVSELEGLTAVEPLREELWLLLARALQRNGRQADALRLMATYRHTLREELGLDPSAWFVALERRVLDGDQERGDNSMHGGAAPPSRADTLGPSPPNAIIGRETVINELLDACGDTRWVTLSGPGGVGKSTVAMEVARRLGPAFRNGVRVVELSVVDDGAVANAIAQAVMAERRAERSLVESIAEVLGSQEILLVLDNCEHVLERVGEVARHLLRWCPTLTVLATSREALSIPGERVWAIAPLAVPSDATAPLDVIASVPAVAVFVARACEVSPDFVLDACNAPIVAEICVQLDGLPLALELAAARMSALTPRQLAERLHQRFALLGRSGGGEQRHRSLLDVVQWSYGMLDPVERLAFERLSVFAGGFDLDAAESVVGVGALADVPIAPILLGLVAKSLVLVSRDGEYIRYSMLETLRQFAEERLEEAVDRQAVLRAHVVTYVARAEVAAAGMHRNDESVWAAAIERDTDNMRDALNLAVAFGDPDAALRLVTALAEFAFRRIRYEFIDWAERVLTMPGVEGHALMPTAVAMVSLGAFVRGELPRAVELGQQAVAHQQRLGVQSTGLAERALGNALFYLQRRELAVVWIERFVDAGVESGIPAVAAHGLYMRSVAQTSLGDPTGGVRYAERALAEATLSQCPTALAHARYALAFALDDARSAEAIELFEEAAALADSVGNRWLRSFARTELYWLRAKQGDTRIALEGYRELVVTWFRGGEWANQWLSLRQLVGILGSLGHDEDAAMLFGAVDAAGATAALPLAPMDAADLGVESRAVAERLGTNAFLDLAARGAAMREDAAVDYALRAITRALCG